MLREPGCVHIERSRRCKPEMVPQEVVVTLAVSEIAMS